MAAPFCSRLWGSFRGTARAVVSLFCFSLLSRRSVDFARGSCGVFFLLLLGGVLPVWAQAPAAPANVSVSPGTNHGELDISWDAVSGATGYRLRYCAYGRFNNSCPLSYVPSIEGELVTGTTHTATGLVPVIRYSVGVRSVSAAGNSAWTEILQSRATVPQGTRMSTRLEHDSKVNSNDRICTFQAIGMAFVDGSNMIQGCFERGRIVRPRIGVDECRGNLQYDSTTKKVSICAGAGSGSELRGLYRRDLASSFPPSTLATHRCSSAGAVRGYSNGFNEFFLAYCDGSRFVRVGEVSTDSSLSSLALSDGEGRVVDLSPTFASGTTAYTAGAVSSSVTVTATANSALARSITVNGATVESGVSSAPIDLSVGANTVMVEVVAESGGRRTYRVAVERGVGVSLSVLPRRVEEGGTAVVTAMLTEALGRDVEIPIVLTRGTAEDGDYGALEKITVSAMETSGTGTIVINQDVDEEDETFTASLGSPLPSGVVAFGSNAVELLVVDDEIPGALPESTLWSAVLNAKGTGLDRLGCNNATTGATCSAAANLSDDDFVADGKVWSVVLLNDISGSALWVRFDRDVRTALDGYQFCVASQGFAFSTATHAANEFAVWSESLDIPWADGDVVSLSIGRTCPTRPRVSLSVMPNPVLEGTAVTVRAELSVAASGDVVVPLVLENGTAEDGDYGALASVTIADGTMVGTGTLSTMQEADTEDETFTVSLGALPDGIAMGRTGSVEVVILDDDVTRVSLSAAPNPVEEGTAMVVTASLSAAASGAAVVIPLVLEAGTAESGDYGTLASITIADGETSGTGTLSTMQDDDTLDETFTVRLGTLPAGVVAESMDPLEVVIWDDDVMRVSLSAAPNPVEEGTAVVVTASLSAAASGAAVVIPLVLEAGTAESGDYGTLASITIADGETSGTGTLSTMQDDDTLDETFTVRLGTLPAEVVAGSDAAIQITIADLDAMVMLEASPNPVPEGTAVVVTATLSRALGMDVVIPLVLEAGTAEDGDYGALASITVDMGETSGTGTVTTMMDDDGEDETFEVSLGDSLPTSVVAGTVSEVEVVIADDEVEVSLSAAPETVTEGSSVTVTVTLSRALGSDVMIPLEWAAGTMNPAEDGDYGTLASITVNAGRTSATGMVNANQDADSDDETFTVSLGSVLPSGVVSGAVRSVVLGITDDDLPQVSLGVAPNPVEEGGTLTVTVALTRALAGDLVVPLVWEAGTAEDGDYSVLSSITVSAGETSGTGTITIGSDADTEDETFTVRLGSLPAEVVAGSARSVAVVIEDDETEVSLSAAPNPVEEGAAVTVTVRLGKAASGAVEVPVVLETGGGLGTAEDGDYGVLTMITVADGETSGTGSLSTNQDMDADDETFTVRLGSLPASLVAGSETEALVRIRDDDAWVSLSAEPVSVAEGSAITLTATLSRALGMDVVIPLLIAAGSSGTAEDGDYGALASVTVMSGETSGTGSLSTNQDDDVDDETFEVRLGDLSSVAQVFAGTVSVVALGITDDDALVSLGVAPNPVLEGVSATVTVTLSRALASDAVVPLVLEAGTAEDGDYGALASVTVMAGETSGTGTLSANEDTDTDNETLTVRLGDLSGLGQVFAGSPSEALVTITDDDLPQVSLSVAPNPVEEGGTLTVTVALTRALAGDLVVPLVWEAGTAEEGDYSALSSITVSTGETSGTGTITIGSDADADDETFTVRLGSLPAEVVAGNARSVEVVIEDDETEVSLSAAPNPVEEGAAVTVTVRLGKAASGAVEVPVVLETGGVLGTAEDGDYGVLTMITVADGETSGTGSLSTNQDMDAEDETFTVRLGSLPASLVAGSENEALVMITDDDALVSLSAVPVSVAEGSAITLTATLSRALGRDVVIPLVLEAGTAEDGDYGALASVTVMSGETSGTGSLSTNQDDDVDDETFEVRLGDLSGVGQVFAGTVSVVALGITDDDARVSLSVAPNPVEEGASATVTATLSRALASDVVVPLVLEAGTAEDGDYGALASVTVRAGETSGTGTLSANEDVDTDNETLTVRLGDLSGLGQVFAGSPSEALVTITDNDLPQVSLSVAPNPVEEGGTLTVTVALTRALAGDLVVPLVWEAGTTEEGDYSALASITVGAGETSDTGTVTINEDDDTEDETFTVRLGALPAEVVAGSASSVEVVVRDDDVSVVLSATPSTVEEGGTVTLEVLLSEDAGSALSIPLVWRNGTAEDEDYERIAALSVAAGERIGTAQLGITEDSDTEDETFTVGLGSLPSGVVLGGTDSVEITVQDDDVSVSLSVVPSEVEEGLSVLLRAELSEAVGVDLSIPLRFRGEGSEPAEAEDYVSLSSIAISAGELMGSARVRTNPDEDSEDETIEVSLALDALPSGVVSGERSSVLITIVDDDRLGETAERLHRTVLPEVVRALSGRSAGSVRARVEEVFDGTGSVSQGRVAGQPSVMEALAAQAPGFLEGNRSLPELLGGSGFALPLSVLGEEVAGEVSSSAVLWGSGDFRSLSGVSGVLDWDGSLYGADAGVDVRVREDWLLGLSFSWSRGDFAYREEASAGDYGVDIVSVQPYVGWRMGGMDFWAMGGYGLGTVEVVSAGEELSEDLDLWTVGLGGSGLLWSEEDWAVRMRGEFLRTEIEVEEGEDTAAVSVSATLARFGLEGSRSVSLSGGGEFRPSLSLGGRYDGGDGDTGAGVEVSAGVGYVSAGGRLSARLSAHGVLGRGDYEEWGLSGFVELKPSVGGRGWSFTLRPGYGSGIVEDVGTGRVWTEGLRGREEWQSSAATGEEPGLRLESRLGYGVMAVGVLWTPWGSVSLEDAGRRYRLGMDWGLGSLLRLNLSGERYEGVGALDHGVLLEAEARF